MKKSEILLLCFTVLLFIGLAVVYIRYPGFQYDELLFANAALGGIDDKTFLMFRIGQVPLYVFYYIGALKSWIYMPIFSLFGVSYASVRIPMVLLAAATVPFFYAYVRRITDRSTAALSVFLTYLNPAFISLIRLDVGPSAIAFALRVAAFAFFYRFIVSKRSRYLLLLAATFILGFFNKMDYAWFISSFVLAAYLINRKELFDPVFAKYPPLLRRFTFVSFFLLGLQVLIYLISFNYFTHLDSDHFRRVTSGVFNLLNGTLFLKYLNGNASVSWDALASLIPLFFIVYGVRHAGRDRKAGPHVRFHFALSILSLIQMYFMLRAHEAWHIIYLYPSLAVVAAYGIVQYARPVNRKFRHIAVAGMAGAIVLYSMALYAMHIQAFAGKTGNVYWSNSINQLIGYARQTDARFVSIDWGTHTQLLVATGQRNKYFNEWENIRQIKLPEKEYGRFYRDHLIRPGTQFILHPPGKTLYETSRANFFKILERYRMQPQLLKTVKDHGEPVYEVYAAIK